MRDRHRTGCPLGGASQGFLLEKKGSARRTAPNSRDALSCTPAVVHTVSLGNRTLGRAEQTETPNPDDVLLWWLYQHRRVELVRLR